MDDCACEDNHRTPYCACVKLTIEFRAGVRGAAREKPGKRNQESVMNLEDERGSRVVAAQAERRLQPRYHIKIQIELFAEGNGQPLQLDTVDLSRNGCCVWIQNPLPVGTRLRAVLHLATKPVVVRGCVVTRHPRFGNGIMFLVFEGDGDERLRKYLESLRGETID